MAIVDSILTFLRDQRSIRRQDRSEVSTYLRRIADCCLAFRDAFNKVRAENQQGRSDSEIQLLREQVDLVEEYLRRIDSVLGNRVASETLDEVAVTVGRIITVEVPLVHLGYREHSAIGKRLKDSWGKYQPFVVVLWNTYLHEDQEGKLQYLPIQISHRCPLDNFECLAEMAIRERAEEIYGRDPVTKEAREEKDKYVWAENKRVLNQLRSQEIPTVDEFLAYLSKLHSKIRVMADAIELGASV